MRAAPSLSRPISTGIPGEMLQRDGGYVVDLALDLVYTSLEHIAPMRRIRERMNMTLTVNVHEAKTQLSKLLLRVSSGEEIIIARAGKPVARLVPVIGEPTRRLPGSAAGQVWIAADFDAPLPEEILGEFEG